MLIWRRNKLKRNGLYVELVFFSIFFTFVLLLAGHRFILWSIMPFIMFLSKLVKNFIFIFLLWIMDYIDFSLYFHQTFKTKWTNIFNILILRLRLRYTNSSKEIARFPVFGGIVQDLHWMSCLKIWFRGKHACVILKI